MPFYEASGTELPWMPFHAIFHMHRDTEYANVHLMSRSEDTSDEMGAPPARQPKWLDGMTPEEQLAEIDAWEAYVRDVWDRAPPWMAKTSVGDLDHLVAHYNGLRRRISAGLPPLDLTEEEQIEEDRFWAEIKESMAKRNFTPFPPDLR